MSSMTLEEVEKALYQKMGAPMVIYNERQDTYILKRLFSGHLERSGLRH